MFIHVYISVSVYLQKGEIFIVFQNPRKQKQNKTKQSRGQMAEGDVG